MKPLSKSRRRLAVAAAVTLVLGAPSNATARDEAPEAAAAEELDTLSTEELVAQGRTLLKDKRWAEAATHLNLARKRGDESFAVVGNLGIAQHELERWVPAARNLRLALDHLPPDKPEVYRQALLMRLGRVVKHVVALEVKVAPEAACVTVNVEAPHCGKPEQALYVAPGDVVVRVEADGHRSAREERSASAGEELSLTVTLTRRQTPVQTDTPLAPVPVSRDGLPVWPGYLTLGLGAATTIVGGVLFAQSNIYEEAAANELSSLRDDTGKPAPCATPPASSENECETIQMRLSQHDDFRNAALGSMIGGGALMVTGGVLLGLGYADEGRERSALSAAPIYLPGGGGIVVGGSW